MAEGIPVNILEYDWLRHFFRFVGVVALMTGMGLASMVPNARLPGVIVCLAGIVALAVNEVLFARWQAAARTVIDTGSGFRWLGGPVDVDVRDDQVVAVRLKQTPKFSAGLLKGKVRRFEVWTEGSEPMQMVNRLNVAAVDPLDPLIVRLIEDLKQRTAAGLAAGAVLEGDDWRLAAAQFSIGRGSSTRILPFAEIDKVGVYDGKICLWRTGQDEPAARIKPDTRNAPILAALIAEWNAHKREGAPQLSTTQNDTTGLGRLLFERRKKRWFMAGLGIGGH